MKIAEVSGNFAMDFTGAQDFMRSVSLQMFAENWDAEYWNQSPGAS